MPQNIGQKIVVIVVGGTGFIGRRLVEQLAIKGIPHISISRGFKPQGSLNPKTAKLTCDVCLPVDSWLQNLKDLIDGQSRDPEVAMVNCAGLVSQHATVDHYQKQNLGALQNLMSASPLLGVKRFVHISSSSIYASFRDQQGLREDQVHPEELISPYAASKWQCEEYLKNFDHYASTAPTRLVLRPQLVYGPGESVFLPSILAQASGLGLPKTSRDGPELDFTYVGNLVEAILLALQVKAVENYAVYNVTDGAPVKIIEAIQMICRESGRSFKTFWMPKKALQLLAEASENFSSLYDTISRNDLERKPFLITKMQASVFTASRTLSISKAKAELGYQPKFGSWQGLHLYSKTLRQKSNASLGT
jgi:nucleoside-diphosphate-sugar epimerase